MNNSDFTIITFYQFKQIDYQEDLKKRLKEFCLFNKIRGTTIIAKEGINGTLAGLEDSIKKLICLMVSEGFNNLELKFSIYKYMAFNRIKIKLKKEIVTFRSKSVDPENITAKHVNEKEWNMLIDDNKTIVVDVRNDFEYSMGSFEKAINPKTKNFTEFKKYIDTNLKNYKEKKIAIFCTGGIRCEKASSYMIKKGFKDVNQLQGGILKYLEKIPKKISKWKGECFVFDNRVSLKHGLKVGTYSICSGCRKPISKSDKSSTKYEMGVSCPNCHEKLTNTQKERFRMRQKQIVIAKKSGKYHIFKKDY